MCVLASVAIRFSFAVIVAGLLATVFPASSPAFASAPRTPLFAPIGVAAKAPKGWADFCVRNALDCKAKRRVVRYIRLSPAIWNKLVTVNAWVNERIRPKVDMRHWGVPERWDYPTDGYGDCEDYALLKRRILIELGLPREALLMTVVWDQESQGHAVLTVHTNGGDYILDNRVSEIRLWSRTGYSFVKRESPSDPNVWVYIDGEPQTQPTAVASGF